MHYTLFESFLDVAVAAETAQYGGADSLIGTLTGTASAEELAAIPRMVTLNALQRAFARAAEDFDEYECDDAEGVMQTFAAVCLEEAVADRMAGATVGSGAYTATMPKYTFLKGVA